MANDENTQTPVNDSETSAAADAGLTRPGSGFDPVDARRDLIALAVKYGPDTPIGHRAYGLVELTQNLPDAEGTERAHIVRNIQRINRELAGLLAAAH